MRAFYAAGGPGDLIAAHAAYRADRFFENDVCLPFATQIEQACATLDVPVHMVSPRANRRRVSDGAVTIEHVPRPTASGWRYHLGAISYALKLVGRARQHKADVALLDSGSIEYFLMILFHLSGIKVVPILHNTLWVKGFPRRGLKVVQWLNDWFLRKFPFAVIGVSPECVRQLEQIAPSHPYPVLQVRAQFAPEFFRSIAPPPDHQTRPFEILFVGRSEESKGVFDIVDMAARVEETEPGRAHWTICGTGPALEALIERAAANGLSHVIDIRGWVSLDDLHRIYGRSHVSIVPTRSGFNEGLAMTAAEAILAGRPVVTNAIVPALEVLRPACEEATPENIPSHADAVLRLMRDKQLWLERCRACRPLQSQFYDDARSLRSVVERILVGLRDR